MTRSLLVRTASAPPLSGRLTGRILFESSGGVVKFSEILIDCISRTTGSVKKKIVNHCSCSKYKLIWFTLNIKDLTFATYVYEENEGRNNKKIKLDE